MPSELRWWFGDRDYYLREQTEDLQASLSAAASRTSRLQSQLARVQGSLEQRVGRLAAAFDAFVELSDLRSDLTAFTDAAVARHRVRQLVLNGVRGGRTQPLVDALDDVPGYWLVPAAQAFAALARGNTDVAAAPLREAQDRDRARTGLFLVSALGVAGGQAAAAPWLDEALALIGDGEVSVATRTLWLAAASGRYGGDGARRVAERLETVVTGVSGPRRDEVTAAWAEAARTLPQPPIAELPRGLARDNALRTPFAAAAALQALRSYCESALTPPEPGSVPAGGTGPAPGAGPAPGGGAAPGGGVAGAEPSDAPPSAVRAEADPLARLVVDLLEEGSPDEAPLLARVRELREVIESNGAAAGGSGRPRPDAPVGATLDLLRDDAFGAGVDAPVRAIALTAGAPLLHPAVEALAAEATTRAPAETSVTVSGVTVRVGPAGGADDDLRKVDASLTSSYPVGRRAWIGYAGAAVGVVLVIVGVLAGVAAATVLGVVLVAAGIGYAIYAVRDNARAKGDLTASRDEAHRRVASATTDLDAYHRLHADMTTKATADAKTLTEILTAPTA